MGGEHCRLPARHLFPLHAGDRGRVARTADHVRRARRRTRRAWRRRCFPTSKMATRATGANAPRLPRRHLPMRFAPPSAICAPVLPPTRCSPRRSAIRGPRLPRSTKSSAACSTRTGFSNSRRAAIPNCSTQHARLFARRRNARSPRASGCRAIPTPISNRQPSSSPSRRRSSRRSRRSRWPSGCRRRASS